MRSRILSSALALMMVAAFAFEVAAQGGQPGGGAPAAPGAGGQPIHEWLEVRPFLTAPPSFEH